MSARLLLVLVTIFVPSVVMGNSMACGVNVGSPPVAYGSYQQLRDANVQWVRMEFIDPGVSGPQPTVFAQYDPYIASLRDGSPPINILMIIDYTSWEANIPAEWAPLSEWQRYSDAFVARLQLIVAHYKGQIAAYEIVRSVRHASRSSRILDAH